MSRLQVPFPPAGASRVGEDSVSQMMATWGWRLHPGKCAAGASLLEEKSRRGKLERGVGEAWGWRRKTMGLVVVWVEKEVAADGSVGGRGRCRLGCEESSEVERGVLLGYG
ncbi:unnamed protein product [Linum trigynum]|uniref:Uncharacterized protein n=1 Tax=Linum trigynum TaxID=586398 RepID=A0AAV2FNG9_9ROSI